MIADFDKPLDIDEWAMNPVNYVFIYLRVPQANFK